MHGHVTVTVWFMHDAHSTTGIYAVVRFCIYLSVCFHRLLVAWRSRQRYFQGKVFLEIGIN